MPRKSSKKPKKSLSKSTRKALSRASQATLVKAIGMKASRPSLLRTGGYSFKAQGGQELNFVDTKVSVANGLPVQPYNFDGVGNTNGAICCLNGTTVGAGNNQRIGRRIDMKSLQWLVEWGNMDAAVNNTLRWALIVDSQANGALPLITDIYVDGDPLAMRNISNKARFRVLADSGPIRLIGNEETTMTVGQFAPNGTNPAVATTLTYGNLTTATSGCDKGYKKVGINTQYNAGAAGTIADIQTNSLLLVIMCDCPEAVKTTLSIDMEFNFRLRYLP